MVRGLSRAHANPPTVGWYRVLKSVRTSVHTSPLTDPRCSATAVTVLMPSVSDADPVFDEVAHPLPDDVFPVERRDDRDDGEGAHALCGSSGLPEKFYVKGEVNP